MRAFPVSLPSGVRYWTVLDEDLAPVPVADAFLRHVRLGRDGSELTTRSYAGSVALFLRWCARTGRDWRVGVEHLGLFVTWLRHAQVDGDASGGGQLLTGPGRAPVRGARRVNGVLAAVRGLVVHAVAATPGETPPFQPRNAQPSRLRTTPQPHLITSGVAGCDRRRGHRAWGG